MLDLIETQSDVFSACYDEPLSFVPEGCEVLSKLYKHCHIGYDTWKKSLNFIKLPSPVASYKANDNSVYNLYSINDVKELINKLDLSEVRRFELDDEENNPLWVLPEFNWHNHLECIMFNSLNWLMMNTRNMA